MSLHGNLDQFKLVDLLQILSWGRKTGKLVLGCREGTAIVVLRDGRIVYASASTFRQTLGSLLICRGLIRDSTLAEALDQQRQSTDLRLGEVLVEMGALERGQIDTVVAEQIGAVISELAGWKSGSFRFERLEIADHGELFDQPDLELSQGVGTDRLLVGLVDDGIDSSRELTDLGGFVPSSGQPAGVASLRRLMTEVRSPEFTGEITQSVLDQARHGFERGVLFAAGRHDFNVVGFFGVDLEQEGADERMRAISVPPDEPSILKDVVERRSTVAGELAQGPWNRYIVARLGGAFPSAVAAVPLTVSDRVVLIFYGENPVADSDEGAVELELLMNQLGLAMEKALLEKRLAHHERLRSEETTPSAPPRLAASA